MKFNLTVLNNYIFQSHPARGAWIEIVEMFAAMRDERVAPRKGCVD